MFFAGSAKSLKMAAKSANMAPKSPNMAPKTFKNAREDPQRRLKKAHFCHPHLFKMCTAPKREAIFGITVFLLAVPSVLSIFLWILQNVHGA